MYYSHFEIAFRKGASKASSDDPATFGNRMTMVNVTHTSIVGITECG
jgi:hypothetical protein